MIPRAPAPLLLLCLLLLPACTSADGGTRGEPTGGCLLAAVNRREVLQARGYLDPRVPARLLGLAGRDPATGRPAAHAALVYRLRDGAWWVWDDTFLARRLPLPASAAAPDPTAAARLAFPGWPVREGRYLEDLPPDRL